MNDASDGFFETATFCKTGDIKRPAFVGTPLGPTQVCDDDLANPAGFRETDETGAEIFTPATVGDAVPTGWYVRVMFDELLDPNVEDLIEITEDGDNDPATPETGTGQFTGSLLRTQPVSLKCTPPGSTTAVDVAYDGYYSPSGNNVTWPLGPSLFIQPVDLSTVATGSSCTVAINGVVTDKDGTAVPTDQTGADGSITWDISPLEFIESDPAPADEGDPPTIIAANSTVVLSFNAFIDPASLAAAEVTIVEHATADCASAVTIPKTAVIGGDPADGVIELSIAGAAVACPGPMPGDPLEACTFNADKAYTITFSDTNAVADVAGGPGALPGAADFSLCFVTEAP